MQREIDSRVMAIRAADGSDQQGTLENWQEPDVAAVGLALRLPNRTWTATGPTYWDALRLLRGSLENDGLLIVCYGASRHVYPSFMILDMGYAELAYRMTLGQPARQADLVRIFDTGADVHPVTVAEQDAFYAAWLRSIAARGAGRF